MALDKRGTVKVTTNIAVRDDPRAVRAKKVVATLNENLEAYWAGLRDGQAGEARTRYEAAQRRARALGVTYRTADELANEPLREILRRVELLVDRDALDKPTEVAAVLGGENHPVLHLSDLLREFEALQSLALRTKSENQIKRWRNGKQRALDDLITVVGDKVLTDLTRQDAIAFRRWWQDRIQQDGLEIDTANKAIGHISRMLTTIELTFQIGLAPTLFQRLRIEGGGYTQRAAFTTEFVRDRLLAPGALAGLNDQARGVLMVMANTGMRLGEVCNLLPETIHLDAPVPYVSVKPIGRDLKTAQSERDMPLVGVALDAMRANPNGFPRYRDKGASLSATINKYLSENGLRPTKRHTAYSLRHCFEDRLTAVEAPEKIAAALMGHKWIRPKYGSGPSLEQKREWLERIAFNAAQDSPPA